MPFIKAHLFDNFEEAENAINQINQGEGIPISDTATTRTYTNAQENNGNIYIMADKVTEKYLGTPTQIELIFNDFEK